MIKEAIEKIEQLSKPVILPIGDDTFAVTSDGSYAQIRPDVDCAAEITLNSLDALVQMVKTEALERYAPPIYIEASGHDAVSCFLQPVAEQRYKRPTLYAVCAKDVPGWDAEVTLTYESALIAVRTRFQQSADTEYLLKLLSEISNGAKVTFADNGIATTVVTQKGVALQNSETIRPIINLKPYRTFQELDQPSGTFHIRISERGISFIEADGGMWKLAARRTIAAYLRENLPKEVEDGRVIVML